MVNSQYKNLESGDSTADNMFSSEDIDGVWVDGKFYSVDSGEDFKIGPDGPINIIMNPMIQKILMSRVRVPKTGVLVIMMSLRVTMRRLC